MTATAVLGTMATPADRGAWTPANDLVQSQILVLDDDPAARDSLSGYLGDHGFGVHSAQQSREADAILRAGTIDLVVIRAQGCAERGLDLCRQLHGADKPRLILTGDLDETDCILALELGADDCLRAPYGRRELLARIRAVLRHSGMGAAADPGFRRFMGLTFDFRRPILLPPKGPPIALTPGEFALLRVFLINPGRVLSRDELLDKARGDTEVFDRVIDVQVSRLRQKLAQYAADQAIRTHRHAGYQFVARLQ